MVWTWSLGTFAWGIFNHKVLWTLKCELWNLLCWNCLLGWFWNIVEVYQIIGALVLQDVLQIGIIFFGMSYRWCHYNIQRTCLVASYCWAQWQFWFPPIIFMPQPKWRRNQDVWFTTPLVSHNQLRLIDDHLTKNCCQIKW
jgi:hypothetical protein